VIVTGWPRVWKSPPMAGCRVACRASTWASIARSVACLCALRPVVLATECGTATLQIDPGGP